MLFNLSLKNFRKSIRDYSIYFFTLILGVAVFYIFNAIETQSAMLEVSRTKENILQIMNSILEGVSLVISFILGYLIVYASSFMLKRRKKEFGIYLILGMKKRQVAGILWLETVFMGMISLAAGLIIGIGLSQFMSLLVSNLSRSFFADSSYMLSFSVLCSCVCSRLISPSVSSWHKQDNTLMHQSPGHIQRRTPYNF